MAEERFYPNYEFDPSLSFMSPTDDIVIDGGGSIQSADYNGSGNSDSPGTAGWFYGGDGYLEASDVFLRGGITIEDEFTLYVGRVEGQSLENILLKRSSDDTIAFWAGRQYDGNKSNLILLNDQNGNVVFDARVNWDGTGSPNPYIHMVAERIDMQAGLVTIADSGGGKTVGFDGFESVYDINLRIRDSLLWIQNTDTVDDWIIQQLSGGTLEIGAQGSDILDVRPSTNPASGSPIFRVRSSGGADRLVVTHGARGLTVHPDGAYQGNRGTSGFVIAQDGPTRHYQDGNRSLGGSNFRWSEVWAVDGSINTSDDRLKADVTPSDLGLGFLNDLEPIRFVRKGGARPHYGFSAQQVGRVASNRGIDFAGYIDPSVDPPDEMGDYNSPGDIPKGLRYHEFIAPIITAIQQLTGRVEALEVQAGD